MEKKSRDRFKKIKYIGYCLALTPPAGEKLTLEDFVKFAKFQLCKKTNTLYKDPIWDKYGDEEILREYFAHLFLDDKEKREEFERSIDTEDNLEIYDWLERAIEDNKKELEEKFSGEDKIEFTPDSIGE